MSNGRWFDPNDNSTRSFVVSAGLSVLLGALSLFCLFSFQPWFLQTEFWRPIFSSLQMHGQGGEIWRVLFGLGAFVHLIAILGDVEWWGPDVEAWDVISSFGPLIGLLLLSFGVTGNVVEWFPRLVCGGITGVCAIVWAGIAYKIYQYGAAHDFDRVVEDFD